MNRARTLAAYALLAGIFVMDGYDLNAMPLALPHVQAQLGLDALDFGIVFSAVLVGLGAGAALFAPLGDRFGRKPLIVIGCLIVAASTIATAYASSVMEFAFWRLITGTGLGVCLPNCTALSAELAPANKRATVMTLVSAGITLGAMAAGLTAPEVVTAAGWEGLFYLPGAFAALLALGIAVVLPAEAVKPANTDKGAKVPQFELFARPWALPFAVFAGALTLNAVNLYLVSQWAPTVLPQAGFSVDQAARVTGLMQGAGFVLGLSMSVLIDRWKPGMAMVGAYLIMTCAFVLLGTLATDPDRWTVLLLVGSGGISGAAMALPALTPLLFPSRLLSSAMGMGVLVARVGAIAGPIAGQSLLTAGASPQTFMLCAALPTLICAAICLGLPRALAVKPREEAQRTAGVQPSA